MHVLSHSQGAGELLLLAQKPVCFCKLLSSRCCWLTFTTLVLDALYQTWLSQHSCLFLISIMHPGSFRLYLCVCAARSAVSHSRTYRWLLPGFDSSTGHSDWFVDRSSLRKLCMCDCLSACVCESLLHECASLYVVRRKGHLCFTPRALSRVVAASWKVNISLRDVVKMNKILYETGMTVSSEEHQFDSEASTILIKLFFFSLSTVS